MTREGIKKHIKVFEQWLNGAEVEWSSGPNGWWYRTGTPQFHENLVYRVKPFDLETGDRCRIDGDKIPVCNLVGGKGRILEKNKIRKAVTESEWTFVGNVELPSSNHPRKRVFVHSASNHDIATSGLLDGLGYLMVCHPDEGDHQEYVSVVKSV